MLSRLESVKQAGAGKWAARCPAHEDQHASLSIACGDDGRVLLHCHAGCAPVEICQAVGLRMGDLFPAKQRSQRRIVATYDYRDEHGNLLFQSVRCEPKDFKQRRPTPGGSGDWTWKLGNTPRVLYRLPELIAADVGEPVFIVEGEKDADNLAAVGLIATTCPQGAGKWNKLSDDSHLHGRAIVIIPDKDEPGRRHAQDVAMRLHGRAREIRVLELPGPPSVKDASDWIEERDSRCAEELRDEMLALVCDAPIYDPDAPQNASTSTGGPSGAGAGGRGGGNILIDTDEHRVVTETIAALTIDPDIYQRGGMLVRVLRDHHPSDGVVRGYGSAVIGALPAANLRERMTRCATFSKFIRQNGELIEVRAHPTPWLVAAVEARGEWPGIRRLMGVSDAPVLRRDGSIWQTPGYDNVTGVLYEPSPDCQFPTIPAAPTIDDARRSLASLLEVVCDFRFENEDHCAAWLAGLLTPLARFAFAGPAPLFLIDANVRGAGKGLLAQTVGWIVLGREMPVSSYAHDSEEMRKKITSIAIAGDRMVLLDNLEGSFGNDALDRALTSTRWKDRILGKSEMVDLPLIPIWYGTGNNVAVAADTTRRIIHVRLDVLDEHPEDRTGFQHPDLVEWVRTHRGRLLCDALTILSAYCGAGRPSQDLTPFGSFEGWSGIVREAVVWIGLPDPCRTRTRLAESSDTTAATLGQLIAAWRAFDSLGQGVVISEMLERLYRSDYRPGDDSSVAMRAALENLVGCPPGKAPTPRQVGNKLRHFRRRVINGAYLDVVAGEYHRSGAVWRLHAPQGASDGPTCESASLASLASLFQPPSRERGE